MKNQTKLVISIIIIVVFILCLCSLQHSDLKTKPDIKQEDELLFKNLLNYDLLTIEENGTLKLPDEDYELIQEAKRVKNHKLPDLTETEIKTCQYINSLFNSLCGQFVRTQIKQWNQTRQLAGIRDNRNKDNDSSENKWFIKNQSSSIIKISDMSECFGYINKKALRSGFGNWLAVNTLHKDDTILFKTNIHIKNRFNLIVQVIGKNFIPVSPKPDRTRYICEPGTKECSIKNSQAVEYMYSLRKGSKSITIECKAAHNSNLNEPGLNIQRNALTKEFYWKAFKEKQYINTQSPLIIYTADRIPLTNSKGVPTSYANDYGLLPLIGFGKRTPYSLYGLISRSKTSAKTDQVVLSIDSKIQSIAQQKLEKHMDKICRRDGYCNKRKGAVVILDANNGSILGAANYPNPPENLNIWDIITYDRFYAHKNPMVFQAWQGIGKHNSPASSFKPLVALAALDMAKNNYSIKDLNNILQDLTKDSKMMSNADAIKKFYKQYANDTVYENVKECFQKNHLEKKLNMTYAIKHSKNIWFQWLALLMDGEKAFEYDQECFTNSKPDYLPDFHLCKIARQFGFGEYIDLAPNLEDDIRFKPISGKAEGDILFAHAGNLRLFRHGSGIPMIFILTRTAEGHSVSATPLQMARIAACIASGKILTPYLFSEDDKNMHFKPKAKKIKIPDLSIIHTAMHEVVIAGTARKAFKNYSGRNKLFGKTGTASMKEQNKKQKQVYKKSNFNTAWFIGWQEMDNNKKIAFACMVSHVWRKDYRFGSQICAPIIKDILEEIYDSSLY